MSNDFTLPILQKIIDDLNIVCDSKLRTQVNQNTDVLNNSIMPPQGIEKSELDSADCRSLCPDTLFERSKGINSLQAKKNNNELDQNYLKLMNKLQNKREEIRERDNKINDLESEIEEIKIKYERLERSKKRLTTNYENLKQEFDDCEKSKDKWEENYKCAMKEIKRLKRVAIGEEEIENYKNELNDHKDQLKKKDNELKQNEKLVNELKQENETLLKADQSKQQAIEGMQDEIRIKNELDPQNMKKLNYKLKANEMELEQADRKIKNLNSAYDEKVKEYDLSVKQNQNLQSENVNLKKLLTSKDQDWMHGKPAVPPERPDVNKISDCWNDLVDGKCEEETSMNKNELKKRDHKINDLQSEIEEIKINYERLERIKKRLIINYENLKQEFDDCEKSKDKWEENYKFSLKEIKRLKSVAIDEEEIENYKNELNDYKDQLKKKDNELKQNEKLVNELKQEIETLLKDGQTKGNHDEFEKYKLEIIEKSEKIAELQEECSKKQQAMVVMREKIRAKTDQPDAVQELKKLNYKLRANEMELEQTHKKIENLYSAYEEKAKEYDLSVKENQNLRRINANLKKLLTIMPGKTAGPSEGSDVNKISGCLNDLVDGKYEEEIENYKNDLNDHKDQLKKKDNDLKENEKLVNELIQEIETLLKANQRNHDELEKYKLEIIEKTMKIVELQEECKK